jgi:hypothetical protein
MCCKLGAIAEVNKPDGKWCQHCSTRTKCDIYDMRPNVCRDYFCVYMLTDLPEEWRPTTAKFMISNMPNAVVHISVDHTRPDAWRREPYLSRFKLWAQKNRVVILVGLHIYAVYPDRIDDLGLVKPGTRFGETTEQTPMGPIRRTQLVHAA